MYVCAHKEMLKIYTLLLYFAGVFYFLSSTTNPILYSVMSKRFRYVHTYPHCVGQRCNDLMQLIPWFRRAFRDKLCQSDGCCLCMCCSEVVIIGGGAASAPPGPIRVRPGDSQSTTTRQRLLATYTPANRNLSVNNLNRPQRELTFAPGKFLYFVVNILPLHNKKTPL